MKYKSSEVAYNEIVYCDIIVEKETKRGRRTILEEEKIKKAVYKELNGMYKKRKVLDVIIRARLGFSFNKTKL